MATRSRIGLLNQDGSVMSVYCHWDGYLSGVGQCLLDNYKTVKDVVSLIQTGNISSLGSDKGSTVFYANPEGDSLPFQPWIDETLELFLKSDIENYGYLFICDDEETGQGKWLVACGWAKAPRKLVLLSQELIDADETDPECGWWV